MRTFPCVAHGGRHVLAGFSGGIEAEDSGIMPRPILFGNFDLCGVMLSYRSDPAAAKRASGFNLFSRAEGERVHADLVELLDAGSIRTVVGRTAPWTELPAELDAPREPGDGRSHRPRLARVTDALRTCTR